MSLVKGKIEKLAETGKIEHEFSIGDTSFTMEPIESEEKILSDGMANFKDFKDKYETKESFSTYPDMIQKFRSVTVLAFAITKVDGEPPVNQDADYPTRFNQYKEFRDELMSLNTGMIDKLNEEYNEMIKKQKEFFDNMKEESGKS